MILVQKSKQNGVRVMHWAFIIAFFLLVLLILADSGPGLFMREISYEITEEIPAENTGQSQAKVGLLISGNGSVVGNRPPEKVNRTVTKNVSLLEYWFGD